MTADDERLRASSDPAFRDAVTFAFGDPSSKRHGLVRLSHGGERSSELAILCAGSEPVAARAVREAAPGRASWEEVTAGGVRVAVGGAQEAWTVAWKGEHAGLDLRFEACSAPAVLDAQAPVARACGMEGFAQLCRVTGSVSYRGRTQQVRCLGQRGRLSGAPDRARIELSRSISAWLGDDRALTLTAVRPAKGKSHLDEAVAGFVFESGEAVAIAEPRLSTTYDGDGRQRRAGLELWMTEEGEVARRIAGETICATTLDLGDRRLDSAVFAWRMEGREGVGRYDVLRRASSGRKRAR